MGRHRLPYKWKDPKLFRKPFSVKFCCSFLDKNDNILINLFDANEFSQNIRLKLTFTEEDVRIDYRRYVDREDKNKTKIFEKSKVPHFYERHFNLKIYYGYKRVKIFMDKVCVCKFVHKIYPRFFDSLEITGYSEIYDVHIQPKIRFLKCGLTFRMFSEKLN